MALLPINTYGDAVLRKKALPVPEITPELQALADDMLETMYAAPGIGLAAPQVGQSVRLIVIDVSREEDEVKEPRVYFNPQVIPEPDSDLLYQEEGCLSVPGIYAEVVRPERITMRALDRDGKAVELQNIDGLLARVIQHECDHLDGRLFVERIGPSDRAMLESKLKKMARAKR